MHKSDRGWKRFRRWLIVATALIACLPSAAQDTNLAPPWKPLPQDNGTAGLHDMLRRLNTTARLMHVTAHPDDEDGGMLTLESRGKGVSGVLMTLTRGEGGQNRIGSNLFDALGVLRTLELTASDRYYGVEQRFSRVADFGYSKSADETFQKWGGHDIALGDMVRVIRTFRPDVLVARFSGTDRDGHGHHQASSIVAREAFRAAADPNRFPEQIKEGLEPWQTRKLYIGLLCGFGAMTCASENYTVKLNTGHEAPDLGTSYIQFALQGLRHQLSQGAGAWTVDPGDRFSFYKMVDSALPDYKADKEQDFWDGMDTSLAGMAARLGNDEQKVPFLRAALTEVSSNIQKAAANETDRNRCAQLLYASLIGLESAITRVRQDAPATAARNDLLTRLNEKRRQLDRALSLALEATPQATLALATGAASTAGDDDPPGAVSPGEQINVDVSFRNGSQLPVDVGGYELAGSQSWANTEEKKSTKQVQPGTDFRASVGLRIPRDGVEYSRQPLYRHDPERDSVYKAYDPRYATLPFPPPVLSARVRYALPVKQETADKGNAGRLNALVVAPAAGKSNAEDLALVPAFSVMLEPGEQVIRNDHDPGCNVKVGVTYNLSSPAKGVLHLKIPQGWRVEPERRELEFNRRGEKQEFQFKVFPAGSREEITHISAMLESGGKSYEEGYSLVTREDLDSAFYFQPAVQRVSVVDVKVPSALKVGYVMGAGDDIPTVLQQIGINVSPIGADKLAGEDLSKYQTIVLGIRAYDTQKDVTANNKKLLDFVSAGGTLMVQYNTGVSDFNGGHFTPYPAQISRARVSVEEAPVEVLAPNDAIFHFPNQITQRDFDGWVQERGLYFMTQWDNSFVPLLACHDPGESEQKGGLLEAHYGKGLYIYNAYAFFRQLPAGVPGAIRLYVNLLSAGHAEAQRSAMGALR